MCLSIYLFPKQCGHTEEVLTASVKKRPRNSIEVVAGAFGIFPVNVHAKWLLCRVHVHFDCAGSRKVCFPVWGSVFLLNIVIFLLLNIHSVTFLSSSSSLSPSSSPSLSSSSSTSSSKIYCSILVPPQTVWGLLPG